MSEGGFMLYLTRWNRQLWFLQEGKEMILVGIYKW